MAVSYDSQEFGTLGQKIGQSSGALGSGMEAMNTTMETVGKIPLVAGWNNYRYQNTFLRGGFLDDRRVMTRGQKKFRPFRKGSMVPEAMGDGRQFVGGTNIFGQTTRRGKKLAEAKKASASGRVGRKIQQSFGWEAAAPSGPGAHTAYKTGMWKGFRKNNLTANPSAFSRFHSASVFGPQEAGFYAPHGGAGFIGGTLNQLTNFGAKTMGLQGPEHVSYFSGGVIGRLGAISKIERGKMSTSALARADMVNARVLGMHSKPISTIATKVASGASYSESLGMNLLERNGLTATAHTADQAFSTVAYEASAAGRLQASLLAGNATKGARRLATVEGIQGKYSKAFAQRILTSGGGPEMMQGLGLRTVNFAGRNMAITEVGENMSRALGGAFEKSAVLRTKAASAGIRMSAIAGYEGMGMETVEKGIIKTLGKRGALEASIKGGSRVGLAVGGEALLAAIPGVNMLFAADMAYQLGKLGGHAIKGAINLGKDAMKSMQGNMRGGMFGSFKDNETAATSRARGVMAIQNSRLNARSLLGSEGAMMAAHYG